MQWIKEQTDDASFVDVGRSLKNQNAEDLKNMQCIQQPIHFSDVRFAARDKEKMKY